MLAVTLACLKPDDGSTALERAKPSLPFAVGTPAMYKVIGDIPITPGTSLADVRRIVDTNPAFEPYLPQKYLLVSCQFNRPVPEPYEGRYLASAMCFVILAQSADARILTTLPTTTPAKPEAGTPVSTVPPTGVPPSPPVRGKLSLPK